MASISFLIIVVFIIVVAMFFIFSYATYSTSANIFLYFNNHYIMKRGELFYIVAYDNRFRVINSTFVYIGQFYSVSGGPV